MVYIIKIYTDGSTKTNPGPGSYAVVMLDESFNGIEIQRMYKMEFENTTNNRMELMALINGIKNSFLYANLPIIYCDSAYCVNMYNEWIDNWAAAGWKRSKNQSIENLDLVQELYELKHQNFFCPTVEKIKGHAGHIGNELCDALAAGNMKKFNKIVNDNHITIVDESNEYQMTIWDYIK